MTFFLSIKESLNPEFAAPPAIATSLIPVFCTAFSIFSNGIFITVS